MADLDTLRELIEQAEEWRAFHKARGVPGRIEALAAAIRVKALKRRRSRSVGPPMSRRAAR